MCESYYTGSLSPNQPATETVAGVVEIATNNDVIAGTNDTKVITPLKLKNVTNGLQEQIDTLEASSDVKDIVDTYQDLLNYDTSTLGNNDIIKVLNDETHNGDRSYYRWVITDNVGSWSYIGSENSSGSATTLPRFSVNNGNTNNQGTMDVLAYNGQTLSFKVGDGTTYAPLTCTDGYSGEQFTKESLDTVSTSSLSADTYNCFIPKSGTQPYLLANTIMIQAEKPADTPTDTIPVMTSNTAPYGAITFENASYDSNILAGTYLAFKQGTVPTGSPAYPPVPNGSSSQSSYIIYTYDESQQPQAGTYQFTYADVSSVGGNRAKIYTIKVYTTDGNYTQVASRSGSVGGFSSSLFTTSLPIASIKIEVRGTGTSGVLGAFRLIQPAITAEGTLWVNNGVEPLEVQVRDNNAQWQPFYDVLAGTVTVNSSHNITAVTNQGFNYFSTVNMHNKSTVAHADIRELISTLDTQLKALDARVRALGG